MWWLLMGIPRMARAGNWLKVSCLASSCCRYGRKDGWRSTDACRVVMAAANAAWHCRLCVPAKLRHALSSGAPQRSFSGAADAALGRLELRVGR